MALIGLMEWGAEDIAVSGMALSASGSRVNMKAIGTVELAWTNLPGIALKMFRYCGAGLMAEEQDRWHPTQKPIALMKRCLCSVAGLVGKVLDPFMGSGSTLIAAKAHGNPAIGIEIEEKYCEIAVNRLRQKVLNFG